VPLFDAGFTDGQGVRGKLGFVWQRCNDRIAGNWAVQLPSQSRVSGFYLHGQASRIRACAPYASRRRGYFLATLLRSESVRSANAAVSNAERRAQRAVAGPSGMQRCGPGNPVGGTSVHVGSRPSTPSSWPLNATKRQSRAGWMPRERGLSRANTPLCIPFTDALPPRAPRRHEARGQVSGCSRDFGRDIERLCRRPDCLDHKRCFRLTCNCSLSHSLFRVWTPAALADRTDS